MAEKWLDQSRRQLNVSRGFTLSWVFALQSDADFATETFSNGEDGQKQIKIVVVPRLGAPQ